MGSAPLARLNLLGLNEYQWAFIQNIGYTLESLDDFMHAKYHVGMSNIGIKFAHTNKDLCDCIREASQKLKDYRISAYILDKAPMADELFYGGSAGGAMSHLSCCGLINAK